MEWGLTFKNESSAGTSTNQESDASTPHFMDIVRFGFCETSPKIALYP